MPMQPSNRTLLIPGKNDVGSNYRPDMQTLEIWARQPIQQLVAGSGITLDPASGLATDSAGNGPNPITITASGGGGSLNYGTLIMNVGPEDYGIQTPIGGAYLAASLMDGNGTSYVPMVSKASPAVPPAQTQSQITTSWLSYVGASQSACLLPVLTAPTFTGATFITVSIYLYAIAVTSTTDLLGGLAQQYSWNTTSPDIQLTSGETYQTLTTDFPNQLWGFGTPTDITMTAGSGPTGNGLVSSSGDFYYVGGVAGNVNYDAAVFTGF